MPVTMLMILHFMLVTQISKSHSKIEPDSVQAIEWFENNYMKLNNDKCYFLLSGYKHEVM